MRGQRAALLCMLSRGLCVLDIGPPIPANRLSFRLYSSLIHFLLSRLVYLEQVTIFTQLVDLILVVS